MNVLERNRGRKEKNIIDDCLDAEELTVIRIKVTEDVNELMKSPENTTLKRGELIRQVVRTTINRLNSRGCLDLTEYKKNR